MAQEFVVLSLFGLIFLIIVVFLTKGRRKMAEPYVKLASSVVCKVDPDHGPNQKGWWNEPWMDTPVCNDYNVACDFCITHTLSELTNNSSKEKSP